MFWIQKTGLNRNNINYKLYYAEYISDISILPTNLKEGKQINGDTVANHKCALGAECFCLEDGTKHVLTTNGWQKVIENNSNNNSLLFTDVATTEEIKEYLNI